MNFFIISLIASIAVFLNTVECNPKDEEQCIDYYKTGDNFDLKSLEGDWYAVYYWPPIQRQRERCEVVNFKETTYHQLEPGCGVTNETLIQSNYKNVAGKQTQVIYYGQDEVKHQIRLCNRVSKYIFIDVDDGYVLGINCSIGGRGLLLAKTLPTAAEVENVVEDIKIMSGRRGRPDCKLAS